MARRKGEKVRSGSPILCHPESLRLFRSFRVCTPQPDVFNLHHKTVILSEAPRGSLSPNRGFTARSRRTPGMLVGRCSSQLSGHQNDERNQKVTTSERSRGICSFRGPFLEMFFNRPERSDLRSAFHCP